MNIMITGTNGVLGREIANQFYNNPNYHLFLLSNSKNKLKKEEKKIKFIQHDLTKPFFYKTRIDSIIHCAAKNPLSKRDNDMKTIYKKNIQITKNLINFSNENRVKKIIFLSSMDVYGKIKKKVVKENLKPKKANLYGKSKFISENLFNEKKNKFKTVSLRIPGFFALDLKRNQPLLINTLNKIIKNKTIYAYNINSKFNNVTDSIEIVKILKIILKRKIKKNSVYNFSASKPIKFITVLNLMKRIFKSKSLIIEKNKKKKSFVISNKKISRELNTMISPTKNVINRCCKKLLYKNSQIV